MLSSFSNYIEENVFVDNEIHCLSPSVRAAETRPDQSYIPDLCDGIEPGVGRVEEVALLQLGFVQRPHPLLALGTWLRVRLRQRWHEVGGLRPRRLPEEPVFQSSTS